MMMGSARSRPATRSGTAVVCVPPYRWTLREHGQAWPSLCEAADALGPKQHAVANDDLCAVEDGRVEVAVPVAFEADVGAVVAAASVS